MEPNPAMLSSASMVSLVDVPPDFFGFLGVGLAEQVVEVDLDFLEAGAVVDHFGDRAQVLGLEDGLRPVDGVRGSGRGDVAELDHGADVAGAVELEKRQPRRRPGRRGGSAFPAP